MCRFPPHCCDGGAQETAGRIGPRGSRGRRNEPGAIQDLRPRPREVGTRSLLVRSLDNPERIEDGRHSQQEREGNGVVEDTELLTVTSATSTKTKPMKHDMTTARAIASSKACSAGPPS